MASITLTDADINSGTPVTLLGATVVISGSKSNSKEPNPNSTLAKVVTNSNENPLYNLSGIYLTGDANTLTLDDVWTLYKKKYTGTNGSTLTVTYGVSSGVNGIGGSTSINVILESFTINVDARDSKNAYLPIVSLVFVESD